MRKWPLTIILGILTLIIGTYIGYGLRGPGGGSIQPNPTTAPLPASSSVTDEDLNACLQRVGDSEAPQNIIDQGVQDCYKKHRR